MKVSSLLYMKDMLLNTLDISLQGRYIYHKGRRQPLDIDNMLLTHRWRAADAVFYLYRAEELIRIHWRFGQTSVKTATGLPKRAGNGKMDAGVNWTSRRIKEV